MTKMVKKFVRCLKGKVDALSIATYLRQIGYSVILFHTPEGDEYLKRYHLIVNEQTAFTFCGSTKIVFIDNNLSNSEKIYSLLHESGHILLGHIGNNTMDLRDKRTMENEAEAFAYAVLHFRQHHFLDFGLKMLLVLLSICCIFLCLYKGNIRSDTSDNMVYLTATGEKYHNANCHLVRDKDACIEVPKIEAQKIFSPCKLCSNS